MLILCIDSSSPLLSATKNKTIPETKTKITELDKNSDKTKHSKPTNRVNKTATNTDSDLPLKDQQTLMKALEPADEENGSLPLKNIKMPINTEKCEPGFLKSNVTLKGGRKAGEFIEIKGLKDMKECVKRCCEDRDKKCNLAFMLGDTCYSVACKNSDLCRTIAAPPTKFNPLVQYVRGLEEEPMPSTTGKQ